MTRCRSAALLLLAIGTLGGCRQTAEANAAQAKKTAAQRIKLLSSRLASADSFPKKVKPVGRWVMPKELRELSGLALTSDGELLAQGDEQALIYLIDPRTGIVTGRFQVGNAIHGDFEGITTDGKLIWLLQSNGKIYEFRRGADGAHVPYAIRDTRLGKECEFESIAYQPDSAWLVLPCKRAMKKSMDDFLVIYRMRLRGPDAGTISQMTVPLEDVIGSNKWKSFRPSDMTIDPFNGNYVIIASQQKGMVVLTPDGDVVRSEALHGRHPQAEGVAITRDSILIVSDEATNTPAVITLYRWHP